jgi:hypothetical protein
MGAAWKLDPIRAASTEATFEDRECCDAQELGRQAEDNAPCLLAREITSAQIEAMASKYRPKRRMQVVSLTTPRASF